MVQDRVRTQNDSILEFHKDRLVRGQDNNKTHPDRGHDGLNLLRIQFQHTIQNRDLVIPQRFLSCTMELEERLELCFLVRVVLARSEHEVEESSDGPSDRGCHVEYYYGRKESQGMDVQKMYIIPRTRGAHAAPIESPYLTLTA